MNFTRTCLAVLLGFVLGAVLSPSRTKADGSSVSVRRANIGSYTTIMGSNVVGFSCAGSGECYIASQ
jgi:hypothetical protein